MENIEANPETSLRERRRWRTWNAIHDSAVELVKANGLKQATVEEIADRASVSPRTFFNYFSTKEDAVLGLRPPQLTEKILERDAEHQDLYIFERLSLLMLDVLESSTSPRTHEMLVLLLPEHGELKARIKWLHAGVEKLLNDFLLTVDWEAFVQQGRRGEFPFLAEGLEPGELTVSKARAAVYISFAVLRHISRDGAIPPKEEREAMIAESVALIQSLLRA